MLQLSVLISLATCQPTGFLLSSNELAMSNGNPDFCFTFCFVLLDVLLLVMLLPGRTVNCIIYVYDIYHNHIMPYMYDILMLWVLEKRFSVEPNSRIIDEYFVFSV